MEINKPKIYAAGKTWMALPFRIMRNDYGYNIIGRWIDVQDVLVDENDAFSPEIHANEKYKRAIWDDGCKVDCRACDLMILFTEPRDGNMLSGALVELGHVTAWGKPVYIIGTSESVEPVDNSDRAWKSQALVKHWPELDIYQGFHRAVNHYLANYSANIRPILDKAASR